MKSPSLFSLYKQNIKKNKKLIIISLIVFIANVIAGIMMFSISKETQTPIELCGINTRPPREGLFLFIYICVIFKLLDFTDNYLYVIKINDRKKLWKNVIYTIVTTSAISSFIMIIFGYVIASFVSMKPSPSILNDLLSLIMGFLAIMIVLCILGIMGYVIKLITKRKGIALMGMILSILIEIWTTIPILVKRLNLTGNFVAHNLGAVYTLMQYAGGMLLLFELTKYMMQKQEIYDTKDKVGDGNAYEF